MEMALPPPALMSSYSDIEKPFYGLQPAMYIPDVRNATNLPLNKSGEREWANKFCACGNSCDTFWLSLCCCDCFVCA
jgi:hypothetical protein